MANALFSSGLSGLGDGTINWVTGVIRAGLIRSYVFNPAHTVLANVTGVGGVIAATADLTAKSYRSGVADAEDVLFPNVPAGPVLNAILIYQASAPTGGADVNPAAQRLIAYIDTAPGLPVLPRGLPLVVTWDNGLRRVFAT